MSLAWLLRSASILSLVMALEMAWVILARRSGALAREAVPVVVSVVIATVALYVSLVSCIAVRVMAPLMHGL